MVSKNQLKVRTESWSGFSVRFLHIFVHLFLDTRLHVAVVGSNPTRSSLGSRALIRGIIIA